MSLKTAGEGTKAPKSTRIGNGKDKNDPDYLPFSEDEINGVAEKQMEAQASAVHVERDSPYLVVL